VVSEQFGTGGYRVVIDDGNHHSVRSLPSMDDALLAVRQLGLEDQQLQAIERSELEVKDEYKNVISSYAGQINEAAGRLAEAIAGEDPNETAKASMALKKLMNEAEEKRREVLDQYIETVAPHLSPEQRQKVEAKIRR